MVKNAVKRPENSPQLYELLFTSAVEREAIRSGAENNPNRKMRPLIANNITPNTLFII